MCSLSYIYMAFFALVPCVPCEYQCSARKNNFVFAALCRMNLPYGYSLPDRYHLRTIPQAVKVIRPLLHHGCTLFYVLAAVVCPAHVITDGMG